MPDGVSRAIPSRPSALVLFLCQLFLGLNVACVDQDIDVTAALGGGLEGRWILSGGPVADQERESGLHVPAEFTIRFEPIAGSMPGDSHSGVISLNGQEERVAFAFSVISPAFSGIRMTPSQADSDLEVSHSRRLVQTMTMALLVEDNGLLPDELYVDLSRHENPTSLEDDLIMYVRDT